jgi:hypothetical protein
VVHLLVLWNPKTNKKKYVFSDWHWTNINRNVM